MDYSTLLNPIEHPLLDAFDEDFEEGTDLDFHKIALEDDVEDLNNAPTPPTNNNLGSNNNNGGGKSGGFFRRSKSKAEDLKVKVDEESPSKKSSPIEIKQGSPAHHKTNNKEKEHQQGSNNSTSSSGGRMSFFKVLTRRNSSTNQGKHKKMTEKWLDGGEPVLDGVAFCVKFLGSTLIEKAGAAEAAEATKTVIQMSKAGHKPTRLGLKVSTNGITLSDPSNGEVRLEISIYDIAHCSADSNHPNVFSFIATNKNDVNECYCFATRKRKMAQHITLTIAQAFNVAFELWQNSSMENCGASSVPSNDDIVQVIVGSSTSTKSNASTGSDIRDWVAFNDQDDDLANHFNSINLVTLSPFHRPSNQAPRRIRQPPANPKKKEDHLLICLN